MASVNKQSLREEFSALKAEFERLSDAGKIAPESRTLFQAMLLLFEVLMAVFMEKHTTKNSRNSSIPPSQTSKDETTETHLGAKGKGKTHKDIRSDNTRTIETVQVVAVNQCGNCDQELSDTPCQGHERRTRIDIVFEKVVSHVDAEIKQCPKCDTQTRGPFPADLSGPLQYGPGIKAYLLNLLIAQMIALKRVQQSIKTLIGMAISEATILKYVMQLHQALEAWEHSAIEQVLARPVLHVDETSLRVDVTTHPLPRSPAQSAPPT